MRRAGRVVGAAQGVLVVRTPESEPPTIGTRVVDERLDEVGSIVDIFGPVERPYLTIAPGEEIALEAYLGAVLYIP